MNSSPAPRRSSSSTPCTASGRGICGTLFLTLFHAVTKGFSLVIVLSGSQAELADHCTSTAPPFRPGGHEGLIGKSFCPVLRFLPCVIYFGALFQFCSSCSRQRPHLVASTAGPLHYLSRAGSVSFEPEAIRGPPVRREQLRE